MNEDEKKLMEEILVDSAPKKDPHIPFFNKYVVPFISIVLLLLFTSYFIFGPIHSTIRGQIASSSLKNNEYSFGKYLLVFYNDTASILESTYITFQEKNLVETSLCLRGDIYNNSYGIGEIFRPKIITATFGSVTFEPCPKDTIVMLHTHPYKSCLASNQDKETLKNAKLNSPHLLMLIMCEERRYTLYD